MHTKRQNEDIDKPQTRVRMVAMLELSGQEF